jgi:hypothetical protein
LSNIAICTARHHYLTSQPPFFGLLAASNEFITFKDRAGIYPRIKGVYQRASESLEVPDYKKLKNRAKADAHNQNQQLEHSSAVFGVILWVFWSVWRKRRIE